MQQVLLSPSTPSYQPGNYPTYTSARTSSSSIVYTNSPSLPQPVDPYSQFEQWVGTQPIVQQQLIAVSQPPASRPGMSEQEYQSYAVNYYRQKYESTGFIPWTVRTQINQSIPSDVSGLGLRQPYVRSVYEGWLGVNTGVRGSFVSEYDRRLFEYTKRYHVFTGVDLPSTSEHESLSLTFAQLKKREPAFYFDVHGVGDYRLSYDTKRWQKEQDAMHAWYDIPYQSTKAYGWFAGNVTRFWELVSGPESSEEQLKEFSYYKKPFEYHEQRLTELRAGEQYGITMKAGRGDVFGVAGDIFGKTPVGLLSTYGMGYGYGALKASAVGATPIVSVGSKVATVSGAVTAVTTVPFIVSTGAGLVSTYQQGGWSNAERQFKKMIVSAAFYGAAFQSGYQSGLARGASVDVLSSRLNKGINDFRYNRAFKRYVSQPEMKTSRTFVFQTRKGTKFISIAKDSKSFSAGIIKPSKAVGARYKILGTSKKSLMPGEKKGIIYDASSASSDFRYSIVGKSYSKYYKPRYSFTGEIVSKEAVPPRGTPSDWIFMESMGQYTVKGRLRTKTYSSKAYAFSKSFEGGTVRVPGRYGLGSVETPKFDYSMVFTKGGMDKGLTLYLDSLRKPGFHDTFSSGLGTIPHTVDFYDFLPGGVGASVSKPVLPRLIPPLAPPFESFGYRKVTLSYLEGLESGVMGSGKWESVFQGIKPVPRSEQGLGVSSVPELRPKIGVLNRNIMRTTPISISRSSIEQVSGLGTGSVSLVRPVSVSASAMQQRLALITPSIIVPVYTPKIFIPTFTTPGGISEGVRPSGVFGRLRSSGYRFREWRVPRVKSLLPKPIRFLKRIKIKKRSKW